MFNRKLYKQTAKKQLAGRRTVPVLATLITTFILLFLGTSSEIHTSQIINSNSAYAQTASLIYETEDDFADDYAFSVSTISDSGVSLLFSILTISITGILILAQCHLYNEYFKTLEKISFAEYLRGFTHWFKGALAGLWFTLWVVLWSFLFFIPGIVKAFSYSQMFFVLAENPKIGVAKAMQISKTLTKGFKADLFVMYISFFGWHFLSTFTFGILQLWIQPYEYMSFTNAYKSLKMHALRTGILTESDFI